MKGDLGDARRLWDSVPSGIAHALRPGIAKVSDEVIVEIQTRIPEYARPSDEIYIKVVRLAVEEAIGRFLDRIEDPDAPWDPEPFRMIGRGEAAEGRNLEPLQTAMRLGARVGWRRLTEIAGPLGLSPQSLYDLGEAIFVYLDQLADAAAEGFDEARAHAAGEMERRRHRLLDLLLSQPPAAAEAISDLAKAAGWRLPRTVAGVALDDQNGTPSLPPDILVGLERPQPCLLVPDPNGPGQPQMLDKGLRGWRAAIGPAVPLERAATSLRWATEALELARRGVLPGGRGAAALLRPHGHADRLQGRGAGRRAGRQQARTTGAPAPVPAGQAGRDPARLAEVRQGRGRGGRQAARPPPDRPLPAAPARGAVRRAARRPRHPLRAGDRPAGQAGRT
ncbi:hypothetical protein GCM10018965_081220 [Nonomuraea roseola]